MIRQKEGGSICWGLPKCFGFLEQNLDTGFLTTLVLYLEIPSGNNVSKISTLNQPMKKGGFLQDLDVEI